MEIRNVTGGKQYTRYVEGHAIVKLTRNDSSRTAISTDYPITDHLGSIDAIADSSGALLYDLSFDAWGRRRAADSTFAIINTPATALTTLTPRGFTGHEMLDTVGLIHMNGRVYDPRLGRFTSADPIVQFPHYSQSFNRYGYVFNNPLSYTDPSGYVVKEFVTVVGDILHLFEGGWTDPQAWIRLALNLKALFEALGGSGSGGNTNNPWVIQNLDGMGPVTAFGNQATIGQGVMGPPDTINQGPGTLQNRVARAVIGATYSDISGGKFANGAATAAFSVIASGVSRADMAADRQTFSIGSLWRILTYWHFEGRDALNVDLPSYEEANSPGSEWIQLTVVESTFHDDGVGSDEEKFIHPDGREVVFDGDTHQIITSDRYRGTYNYVNPAPLPSNILDFRGAATYIGRGVGHLSLDIAPYLVGGTVRGAH